MITVNNISVMNLENAIRAARNPMNSWERSDSFWEQPAFSRDPVYTLGDSDLDLAKRLCNAGSDHRKFLRQIFVSIDINAPLYWWKEMDTYKVGTTANSCSTMHKIASKEFTYEDFSHEHLTKESKYLLGTTIDLLNRNRELFNETHDKEYWWQMIQLLPTSYNQLRTWTADYETLRNIYHARKLHKLDEWRVFCTEIMKLPYAMELIVGE